MTTTCTRSGSVASGIVPQGWFSSGLPSASQIGVRDTSGANVAVQSASGISHHICHFDVHNADPQTLDRYGRNAFGWSLLMARQLVQAGVSLVQVNLGNNES